MKHTAFRLKNRFFIIGLPLLCMCTGAHSAAAQSTGPAVMLYRSRPYLSRSYQVQNFEDTLALQPSQENLPLTLNLFNGSVEVPSFKWFRLIIGGYLVATEQNLGGRENGSLDVTGRIPGGSTQVQVEAGGVPGAELQWNLTTPSIVVQNISPREIRAGDTVTISGANFSAYPNQNTVLFNNKPGTVISASPTALQVRAPDSLAAGADTVQVNVNNLMSNVIEVTGAARPVPELLSTDCWMAPPGGTITITGRNFAPETGRVKVFFKDVPAQIVSASATRLVVIVPEWAYGPGQLNIPLTVTVDGVRSANAIPFDIGPSYHGAIPQIPPD